MIKLIKMTSHAEEWSNVTATTSQQTFPSVPKRSFFSRLLARCLPRCVTGTVSGMSGTNFYLVGQDTTAALTDNLILLLGKNKIARLKR